MDAMVGERVVNGRGAGTIDGVESPLGDDWAGWSGGSSVWLAWAVEDEGSRSAVPSLERGRSYESGKSRTPWIESVRQAHADLAYPSAMLCRGVEWSGWTVVAALLADERGRSKRDRLPSSGRSPT